MMKYGFAGLLVALLIYSGILALRSAQSMQNSQETVLASSAHAVELTAQPVRVELVSGKSDQELKSLHDSRSVNVVLSGLSAATPPGTLFHLYLDLPEGVTPKPGDAWHLGSINFYNAVPGPDTPKDRQTLPTSIDITGVTRKLRSEGKLTSATTITVMATRPPEAGSKAMIGSIAIVVK